MSRAISGLIEHIRKAVPPDDGELLGRFVESSDERALATLIERHGPMVWGVCHRLLGHHDAEDAFQATFIVLVRKAATVNPRGMVGNWLYGVARQAALQVRAARRKEVQVTEMPDVEAPQDHWADLQPLLDEELGRLPDHYRAVIVLSDLEGKGRREVAAQLGCPEGTVASRLVRARAMLAKRLTRRGVALSVGALAVAISRNVSGAVPASVRSSTIEAASLFAAGQAAISVKVSALAEGVLKTMLLKKLKSVMAVLVIAAMVGLIGFGMARGQQTGDAAAPQKQQSEPKAQKDAVVNEKAEKMEAVAWGKEVDGLQAGLAADPITCRPGDKLKLTVKLRNVGKAEVSVTYRMLRDRAPQITTDTGGQVSVYMPAPLDNYAVPIKRTLKPGETITLYNPEVAVESEDRAKVLGEMGVETPTICVAPGKYKIAYSRMIQSHPTLTTGTVEFEVKPASVTAWGKEVGGLQAGLTVAENRAYHTGETVELVVRVRNVGKEPVKFQYIPKFFVENAPTVTDGDGKQVHFRYGFIELTEGHSKVDVSLAPGKEIQLGEVKLPMTLLGTGKFNLHYERVFSNTWGATITLDPALTKLATGKLELEVKEADAKIPV